ncbi:MAG TPA: pyridoxamine 5'-phosphate oxidase family protein [Xanthobacteraceae bacterium]
MADAHSPLEEQLDRAWAVIAKVGVCMMTTAYADGLRARPLEARPDRDAGLIWFVTDVRGAKDDEIAASPEVCLVFIDPKERVYLSVSGRAEVRRDAGKAAEIWAETDTVWWPQGPTDPNVRVIRFEPRLAEYWDGPASSKVAACEFAKARATGEKPNLGENRKVTVALR